MSALAVLDKHTRYRPEPEERRSHQKVRRNSRMASEPGDRSGWERSWARPMTWREKHELIRAAKAYDRANKKPGDRHGPLGPIAIDLLEELCTMAVPNQGRVYVTLAWMQQRLRRARDTIVRAMRALADAKILEWIRRVIPKDGAGWGRGPQVEQTSSVYRMGLPPRLRRFVRQAPPAVDEAHRKATALAAIKAHIREEHADRLDALPAVARANAKIAAQRKALERELGDPSQTVQNQDS